MLKTLINAFRDSEVRRRLFITFALLLVFRIGCYIPVPGVDILKLQTLMASQSNTLLEVLSTVSGGALSQATLFSLGILPFINAFIIMQLLSMVIPPLERLTRQGDAGRRKITQITRYMAIVLAIIQSIGLIISWKGALEQVGGIKNGNVISALSIIFFLTAGSVFVMWLGERITEHGVGNGSSLIIFVGILSSAGIAIIKAIKTMQIKPTLAWNFVGFLLLVALIFFAIVYVDLSERRIKVTYAKQVRGNKMYGGQSTYIPIKVNSTGVMPIIFASAFLTFPQLIAGFWPDSKGYAWWMQNLGVGTYSYGIVLALLIMFFTFFYSQLQFNPVDVSKNLQQYGGMIIGIRPGKPTAEFLGKVNNRITLFGAMFLAIVSLIPSLVFSPIGKELQLTNAFSATGLLIVVAVAMEFNTQVESRLMMKTYKNFLK